ncbi:MAG TPA: ABC transporter substrate-binding protein [Terriglobales bacterium]|nr:ABC transporter substrate-binding protein [Terriglobales bacterium]
MKLAFFGLTSLSLLIVATSLTAADAPAPEPLIKGEEVQVDSISPGRYGGTLVVGQRAEPKTLNPVLALDVPSREVIGRMNADLVHINRVTQKPEPALASSWKISKDGRSFSLKLRRGLRFSDGKPFDADDVIFTFQVYLDEKLHSPQRDLLVINGKPLSVTKLDSYTVRFDLAQPYAAAERIFDSLAILPRHLLQQAYADGKFAETWNLNATPSVIAGLGPFRLKQYLPGQRVVLERNPYYWKVDRNQHRLPFVDQIAFLFVGTEDAQVLRFQAGETDIINRFFPDNYEILARNQQRGGYHVEDLGPSLEFNFLSFNLNDLPADRFPDIAREQVWFRDLRFRQAVASAIDRAAIVRLVYQGHGTALWGSETPADKLWVNQSLPHPERSLDRARELLKSAGFSWNGDGKLIDRQGKLVEFTIITSSSNSQRVKMATIIANDLAQLGMSVHPVPLEFRAVIDRVFQSNNYEACILALGGGDADPNVVMNVWLSSGATHVWNLHESSPATPWEAEIDRLMNEQMITIDYSQRKRLYDRVQQLIADNLPVIFLATPNVLVGAKNEVGNFQPGVLDPYALWNTEELYFKKQR